MKRHVAFMVCITLCVLNQNVQADGGTLLAWKQVESLEIAVFVAPAPPRAGLVDISVLLQDAKTYAPVMHATIVVHLRSRGPFSRTLTATADRDQATNKLFQSAWVTVPLAGMWDLEVEIDSPAGKARVACELQVHEALPPWRRLAMWIFAPIGVVGVFALHWILARKPGATPHSAGGSPMPTT